MATQAPTGTRIRERRLVAGLKQAHLAERVGISASYLNLIEHNRRPIAGRLLGQLAEVLDVDQSALSADVDEDLVVRLRAAGGDAGLEEPVLVEAADLARRFPEWAAAIARQAEQMADQARTIEALSDRLTHDPALAEAMHELLSTVSVVRSTASILAQTPEIDRNWLGRFHTNLDADSRRLADGAEAVVSYLDRDAEHRDARLIPSEMVDRFLESHRHHFPDLEAGHEAIPELVQEIPDGPARTLAEAVLTEAAQDAACLPRAIVERALGPDDLMEAAGGDAALVLRRLGVLDPARGLVVADASGAIVRRKPVAGFSLPIIGAGCPLWPIYEALSQPGRPLVRAIEMPDGAQWLAHAVAMPLEVARFEDAPPLRATMLLTRASRPGQARRVGPGCRVCPRDDCAARREPSVLAPRAATLARTGHVALDREE